MQLRRIASLERQRLEDEYQALQEKIRTLGEILADPSKVLAEVRKETVELRKKFGDKRRTDITDSAYDFSREELEAHEQVVVTLSQAGYIKRISASVYRNQHRGGKGVSSMKTKQDDPVRHILVGDTHDTLLFFTNKGRVLSLTSFELRADTSRTTRGVPIGNVIPLTDQEVVKTVLSVADLRQEGMFLVLATRTGRVERVALSAVASIRPSGLIMMRIKTKDDELVSVRLAREDEDVVIVSEEGMSIRFPVSGVTAHHRGAAGVRGMRLKDGDKVVAMDVGRPDSRLLVISEQGYGKLTHLSKWDYPGPRRPGGDNPQGD